ncbi:alkaline phosphatase family protein [bacterium]|nr:alkaline phosphatase family protein [bacterium]
MNLSLKFDRMKTRTVLTGRMCFVGVWLCLVSQTLAVDKKVVVLGVDGMDPKLLRTFIDQGRLPNFKALIEEGDFRPLQTTMPPPESRCMVHFHYWNGSWRAWDI